MDKAGRYDLLLWLGVLHTDCYVYRIDGKIRELRLRVGPGSLEMLSKWKMILDKITRKHHKIMVEQYHDKRYNKNRQSFCVRESSKSAIGLIFEKLPDINVIKGDEMGAYVAGIIDGMVVFR